MEESTTMEKDSLVIYSGGMDSTTLLAEYAYRTKVALSVDYGSKHNERERAASRHFCELYGVRQIILDASAVFAPIKSDLLETGGAIPEGHYEDPSMKRTVVPFRNGILLALAIGIAESEGCRHVLYGAHAGDHAIYPDCRASFLYAINEAAKAGTYINVNVVAPYIKLTKGQIADIGRRYSVPYGLTWTCYNGREKHCGKCGACVERKEALFPNDPTEYEDT